MNTIQHLQRYKLHYLLFLCAILALVCIILSWNLICQKPQKTTIVPKDTIANKAANIEPAIDTNALSLESLQWLGKPYTCRDTVAVRCNMPIKDKYKLTYEQFFEHGTDCSGFIWSIHKRYNINVHKGSTIDQWDAGMDNDSVSFRKIIQIDTSIVKMKKADYRKYFKDNAPSIYQHLRQGDVLFFSKDRNNNAPSHVALYLGSGVFKIDGKDSSVSHAMIHSPQTGKKVMIVNDFLIEYGGDPFIGSKRILNNSLLKIIKSEP